VGEGIGESDIKKLVQEWGWQRN